MPWLDFYLLQTSQQIITDSNSDKPALLQFLVSIAPLLAFLTAVANLLLAAYIFKFTRRKNNNDRNIKWFQELVFTPNKDVLFSFFSNLSKIKEKIPTHLDLSNDERIEIMDFIKSERNNFMISFVDLIRPIAPEVHKNIAEAVDNLTDGLIQAIDNDELKLNHQRTYTREIANRITSQRNKILLALFNYKG